jgi:hypothetical protein
VRHAGQELQDTLPVFLYGAAHPQQHTLAGIRRSLGYFQGAMAGASAVLLVKSLCSTASVHLQDDTPEDETALDHLLS